MSENAVLAAYRLQGTATMAKHEGEQAQEQAVKIFERSLPDLTDDELERLAEECDEETGPRHCVYCRAWQELVQRPR